MNKMIAAFYALVKISLHRIINLSLGRQKVSYDMNTASAHSSLSPEPAALKLSLISPKSFILFVIAVLYGYKKGCRTSQIPEDNVNISRR